MEGGAALFLLLILVVVGGGIALFMYVGGGALLAKTDHEPDESEESRPVHTRPTSPTQEKVTFAATDDDPEHRS